MRIVKEILTGSGSLALLCLAALGCNTAAAGRPSNAEQAPPAESSAAKLRALGPSGLTVALEAYERLAPGAAKDAQALIVDAVAGQRYATSSKLYWYTDIVQAKVAAQASGTPILSLRMLGRLDEDFSCANSRLFRTVLYANEELSAYLRENFTLHWSSERAVPKLTVDFGDGRILKSTIAGNSAHYLLTSAGVPVDVIPGLYSPKAFRGALESSRLFAAGLVGSDDVARDVRLHHQALAEREAKAFGALTPQQTKALTPYRVQPVGLELLAAEMLTVSKMRIELPVAESLSESGPAVLDAAAVRDSVTATEGLDTGSRELIVAMGPTDWGTEPARLEGSALTALLGELERDVAGDTLMNEHGLHPLIHRLFIQDGGRGFEALNNVVYSEIFATPAEDPWLGMARKEAFTGLPGSGLSVR